MGSSSIWTRSYFYLFVSWSVWCYNHSFLVCLPVIAGDPLERHYHTHPATREPIHWHWAIHHNTAEESNCWVRHVIMNSIIGVVSYCACVFTVVIVAVIALGVLFLKSNPPGWFKLAIISQPLWGGYKGECGGWGWGGGGGGERLYIFIIFLFPQTTGRQHNTVSF